MQKRFSGRWFQVGLILLFTAGSIGVAGIAWAMSDPGLLKVPRLADSDPDQPAAVFDHWSHQQYYSCFACHPAIFPMDRKAFNHDAMDAGEYCAVCHNGTTAFSYDDEKTDCEVCHAE